MKKYLSILGALSFLCLGGCQVVSGERTVNEYSSDSAITAKVKSELLKNKHVTSLPIHVETQDGKVVLSGFVKTQRQKLSAGYAAKQVPEARVVQNNIIVK